MKTIGVFDSGVGGQSVANAIKKALPDYKVIYADDKENIPYGNKTKEQLLELTSPILNKLSKQCDVIVIACNTVTTTIIEELRSSLPVPLIGMEPMVKPAAAQTKTGVIAVCATPATLASARYQWLRSEYAKDINVIEPDCSNWSSMIEHDQVDRGQIKRQMEEVLTERADVIVLGCTHYHWIEEIIREIVKNRAVVLQPEQPVITQLKQVLARLP